MSQATPREILKSILHGNLPERSLVVPIVFSLGAKVENLPLRAYLENATKITNALRQIRGQLRTHGVTCYFDPLLEAEALGGVRVWDSANQASKIEWPPGTQKGGLPARLKSADEAARNIHVTTAAEVIRRLKATLRDEPLLMAAISGPLTLAMRLTQLDREDVARGDAPPEAALELAVATGIKISAAWAEAGANLIFVREDFLPALDAEKCQSWASRLGPVFNIIRFYEALPVLQIAGEAATAQNVEAIFQESWDAVLCSRSQEFVERAPSALRNIAFGIALSVEDGSGMALPELRGVKPVVLTTDGDAPVTTDLKRLTAAFDSISRTL